LLQAVVGGAGSPPRATVPPTVLPRLPRNDQRQTIVARFQAGLAVDERLELLHPIEDRRETHPGALPVPMKPGNSIVAEGCLWVRSFLSRPSLLPLTHPQIPRRSREKRGEIQTRKLWIREGEEVDSIRETTAFPGIKLILRVDSEVRTLEGPSRHETRHLVTSLSADEVSPQRLMALVRGHGSVENGLHFLKDRWWDEDRQ
jgi:hypothetical protein